jgi:hypothetical protein
MKSLLTFFILTLAQVPGISQAAEGFVLKASEDGIDVFVRIEDNDDMTVRVTTTAQTKVSSVQQVLDEAEDYPAWVHRCKEAQRLPGGTENAYLYLSRVNMPFPFRDREVVAAIEQSTDPATGVFTRLISSKPDAYPPSKDYKRVELYESTWEVHPIGNNKAKLICTVRTAAGSGLPGWLREDIMTGGPVKTIKSLRKRVEARR